MAKSVAFSDSMDIFPSVRAFVDRSIESFTAYAESEQFRARRLLCIEFCRINRYGHALHDLADPHV